MASQQSASFLAGVIEGFYGQPWSRAERVQLFEWMQRWGLNTYLYAPKDDLNHRARWRDCYTEAEATALGELIQECGRRQIQFVYGLSPGLDIRYGREEERSLLRARADQMLRLGTAHFGLFFDDIPDRLEEGDLRQWGSLASAQCHLANDLYRWIAARQPGSRLLFCPTPYCGRMAERGHGGENYLSTVGRELLPEIDVFWTGPEIISREIPPASVEDLRGVLRRKPLLWDNLFANDYDGRRFFCGPFSGRPLELRESIGGVLLNPNNEFPLNFVPLHTLASYLRAEAAWEPREAYLAALEEWRPAFQVAGVPASMEELVLLGDCYYLPYEEGPEAELLYETARRLLAPVGESAEGDLDRFQRTAVGLREFCGRLAALDDRPLFYALSRRLWELREELDLLEKCVVARTGSASPHGPWRSDFHLPGTYRGGMVPRLQRLLIQNSDGTFVPAERCRDVIPDRDRLSRVPLTS